MTAANEPSALDRAIDGSVAWGLDDLQRRVEYRRLCSEARAELSALRKENAELRRRAEDAFKILKRLSDMSRTVEKRDCCEQCDVVLDARDLLAKEPT